MCQCSQTCKQMRLSSHPPHNIALLTYLPADLYSKLALRGQCWKILTCNSQYLKNHAPNVSLSMNIPCIYSSHDDWLPFKGGLFLRASISNQDHLRWSSYVQTIAKDAVKLSAQFTYPVNVWFLLCFIFKRVRVILPNTQFPVLREF